MHKVRTTKREEEEEEERHKANETQWRQRKTDRELAGQIDGHQIAYNIEKIAFASDSLEN